MTEPISEKQLQVRIPEREKRLIKKAADITGMTMSQYARTVLNNISIGIILSQENKDSNYVILAESLRSAIQLKAYKLGQLEGEAFSDINKEE